MLSVELDKETARRLRNGASRVWNAIAFDVDGGETMSDEDAAACIVDLGCFDAYCGLSADDLAVWRSLSYADMLALAKGAL